MVCPICAGNFKEMEAIYRCINGHAFDRAKEGYVNLLPANMKGSNMPGDSKGVVAARHAFLSHGYFDPVVELISTTIGAHFDEYGNNIVLADSGCGEGYYLQQLQRRDTRLVPIGFDISKPAIGLAAKRRPDYPWFVANSKLLPIAEQSLDVLLNCFSPFFSSNIPLLKKGSLLIFVNGAEKHLIEMRECLYPHNIPHHFRPRHVDSGLQLIGKHNLRYSIYLKSGPELHDLVTMTPHQYRSPQALQQRFVQTAPRSITVDIVIYLYTIIQGNAD